MHPRHRLDLAHVARLQHQIFKELERRLTILTLRESVPAKQVPDTVPKRFVIWTTLNGHEARNRGHCQEIVPTSHPHTCKVRWNGYGRRSVCASLPEVGAQCGSSARWDLRGGHRVTGVPTATAQITMFHISGVQESPAFSGWPSFLALRHWPSLAPRLLPGYFHHQLAKGILGFCRCGVCNHQRCFGTILADELVLSH